MKRALLSFVTLVLFVAAAFAADDNIRKAQARLKTEGFYFGEVSGTFDNDTSAAITRYQIRKGLQITGQLDAQTATALDVTATSVSAKSGSTDSGSWQSLRKSDRRFLERLETTKPGGKAGKVAPAPAAPSPRGAERLTRRQRSPRNRLQRQVRSRCRPALPAAARCLFSARSACVIMWARSCLPASTVASALSWSSLPTASTTMTRARSLAIKIRADLQRYNAQWPERRFWLAGEIDVQPQPDSRVRVTFPLRYQLRNGTRLSSGQIQKTLLLEVVGEDLQIAAVTERKVR